MKNMLQLQFKNFITLQRGFDLPKKDRVLGNYPVVASTAINGYHAEHKVQPPGVVTGRSGSLGKVLYIDKSFWPLNTTLWVKDFIGNLPLYVYYFLKTLDLKQYNSGAGVPTLNRNHLDTLEIAIHDFQSQRKIASILSAYDDLIENNLRRIKILEEMAQALYREWFVKFRFPGHEKIRVVDSQLGKIPEGWEVVPLEDVCSRITDGAHRSPKTVDIGYPMASVKDMHDWGINVDTCRKISEEEFKNLVHNDCKMLKNDVLIAKDGSYLKHCFVVEKDIDVSLLSSIAMLRPNERIRPHVLAMTLKDSNIKTRMKGYVSGAALPRIILKEFREFEIVLPPFDLQKEWAGYAEPMIELCLRLIKKNTTLRRTRDLLLPKLISGKLDVSDLDIKTGGHMQ